MRVRSAPALWAVLICLMLNARPARADCDPNNPPQEGCFFVYPLGLTAKAVNVPGGVDVTLHWSWSIPADYPYAPDAVYILRGGFGPLPPLAWSKSDISQDTTYTDHIRPTPLGSQLLYSVCSWYTSIGLNSNLCADVGVSLSHPSPPPSPPQSNAGGPGCGTYIQAPSPAMSQVPVTLSEFSNGAYTAAVSLGFVYTHCDMPHDLRFRRTKVLDGNVLDLNYTLYLDPLSWAPTVYTHNTYVLYEGVLYDPNDPRSYGFPQTSSLAEHATYKYELCAENAAGHLCASANLRVPAPPPDPPMQVSLCLLPSGQLCASFQTKAASSGSFRVVGFRNPISVSQLSPSTSQTKHQQSQSRTSGISAGNGAWPGNLALNLSGYRLTWSAADQRTKKIEIQRYDATAPSDHWVTAATVPPSARSADITSEPLGYTYRVCFRGEAYQNSAFPTSGPLVRQLANTCSLPVRVPIKEATPAHFPVLTFGLQPAH